MKKLPPSKSIFENDHKDTKKTAQLDLFAQQKPAKKEKKKVAATSILSFKEEGAMGKFQTLAEKTKHLLAGGAALTSRQISKALAIERNSITAPIKLLEASGEIVVSHVAKCPTTGKVVNHYKLAGHD